MSLPRESDAIIALPVGLVRRLLDDCILAYQRAAGDRGRLHQSEWGQPRSDGSTLMHVEERDTMIAGVASSFVKRRNRQVIRDHAVTLRANAILSCPRISAWLVSDGAAFEDYVAYLRNLELLRLVLQELGESAAST